ncbi:MAG: SDR family NAD(P)-dependent oxidoreductase [Clostridia bacterium]
MRKTALITGASGGLGAELARIFAREGYNLVLVARSGEKLEALKNEVEDGFKTRAEILVKDLAEKDGAKSVFEFTNQKGIDIDVLVNNAGFGDFGPYADSGWDKQYDMIQLNITALIQLTHCYLKPMIERGGGKILNLASIAAFQAGPLMSVYYASKAFVLSFTESLSVELKGTGVTVTALCPGPTRTGFEKAANLKNSRLFKNLKTASAKQVAEYGYKKLMKNKVIAVQGIANKALICASKFAPRRLARYVVYTIQRIR